MMAARPCRLCSGTHSQDSLTLVPSDRVRGHSDHTSRRSPVCVSATGEPPASLRTSSYHLHRQGGRSAAAAKLGAHSAPLGMRFYSGKMFPAKYQGAIFIARHGPWNRTQKNAADVVVAFPDGKGGISRVEPFLTGLVENNQFIGRPADVMVMKDGSLLVSDDHNGAIYRITYSGK
jgi:hypothetical protein